MTRPDAGAARMEKTTFQEHLTAATARTVNFTREFVHNVLPDSFRYLVRLNQSYDGNPLVPGERVYPGDVAQHGAETGPLLAEQVVDLLWREGSVPEWIDISVVRTDGVHTFLELCCCGRFTRNEQHLYYMGTGMGPFGCKGPALPPDWQEGSPLFDLHR